MNDHLQHVYKEEKCVCEVYLKKQTIENIWITLIVCKMVTCVYSQTSLQSDA